MTGEYHSHPSALKELLIPHRGNCVSKSGCAWNVSDVYHPFLINTVLEILAPKCTHVHVHSLYSELAREPCFHQEVSSSSFDFLKVKSVRLIFSDGSEYARSRVVA